jgi:predicted Rossmann-fold nucleotide-binding protein
MPLCRVLVLGDATAAAQPEHRRAAKLLGQLLDEQGIVRVREGESDGFLVLPGTMTLPEVFAQTLDTSGQCGPQGASAKPCGLLNTANYFTELLQAEADPVVERFVQETQRGQLIVERDPAELLRAMTEFRPPETRRQLA